MKSRTHCVKCGEVHSACKDFMTRQLVALTSSTRSTWKVASAIAENEAMAVRPVPITPREETMGALATLHRQGKALYVGISSYSPQLTAQATKILKSEKVPLLIHQPAYAMLNRWIEDGLLKVLAEIGAGCIAFSPLAQGLPSPR